MADRYQGKPFSADDDFDRSSDPKALAPGQSDPLAELARLIGQTDPFSTIDRANLQVQTHTNPGVQYQQLQAAPQDEGFAAGPPSWLRRVNSQEVQQQEESRDYPGPVHPLRRYAASRVAAEPDYHATLPFSDADSELGSSYHDDVLYGQLHTNGRDDSRYDPVNADDVYAYQDEYDEDDAEERANKRRSGMVIVAVVLALAVVGTGAALAYRTYVGSARSGEPPIIKADNSPTKILPEPSGGNAKLSDRMSTGDGTEKIVPREEAPVDVNAQPGSRVVFPVAKQNAISLPPHASGAPGSPPLAVAGNGTLPNSEPRKIKTLTVRGEQPDGAAMPVAAAPSPAAKPALPARTVVTPPPVVPRTSANANAPLSLAPRAANTADAQSQNRAVNNTSPAQIIPDVGASGGGYLVQVSSQKSEADAYASYRALQSKFPAVLGSHASVIKRADLGDKGVYYRAMVGPFGTPEEASQFCGNLKSAGGQCVVQRN